MTTLLEFPIGFRWGFATSAFQIEGATHEAGRADSIWDTFCATPGKIQDGTDGTVACDHFHRWREDVALMKALGARSYRFSVSWPRVLPQGRGAVNQAGLSFYRQLVDALLDADIEPMVTLYHWDLPEALQVQGGWANRETVDAFAEYASVVSQALGPKVKTWMTHNEPWCIAHLGHHSGEHAPGHKNPTEALTVAHHVLLSHGRALPIIRQHSPGARVGLALNLVPAYPASHSAADLDATRAFDGFFNRWYLDPLFRGEYPADVIADKQAQGHLPPGPLSFVQPGDLKTISTPIDFLGVNYYSREICRSSAISEADNAPRELYAIEADRTDMGWEVYPMGLHDLLLRLHRDYHPASLLITENGAAYATGPDQSGSVDDSQRLRYLHGHLRACHQAIAKGVPLIGYQWWSLLDNFEWAFGYQKRFGAVFVDYQTQARTPKRSALWYRDVIAANGVAQ